MHRVQKLLSNYGYCSRRKAEQLIEEGRVTVNGKKVSLGDKASEKDVIFVDKKVVSKEKRVYLMLHKPHGCVTAVKDARYKTVMEYVDVRERVFPIGRLDYNTTGLLLLTNDGDFANTIMHPRYEIKKTYLVEVDTPVEKGLVSMLKKGVSLEDGKTRPAAVRVINENVLEVTIHEGKNRIVRRMFKALGSDVKRLQRVAVGKLQLGGLREGKFRKLGEKERKMIFLK